MFGHADERPYRRLTGDWVRLVLAVVVVAVTAADPQFLHAAERTLDAFFATLPGSFDGVFEVALAVGYVWGLALVVGAALLARRVRLATVIAAGGVLAGGLARFISFLVTDSGVWSALGKVFSGDDAGSYPTVRLAVLAAVVFVASPFLTRPIRRLGQVVLVVVTPGAVVLGIGGVDAVLGALAVGWGAAAALHLALGSPAGRPTMAQVAAALDELGVPTTAVRLTPEQPTGSTVVVASRPDDAPLRVRVYPHADPPPAGRARGGLPFRRA
jgi:glycosyltransferase 2 family protein